LARASGSTFSLLLDRSNVRTVTNWNTADGMAANPWFVSERTPVLEAFSIFCDLQKNLAIVINV
jgi:Mg2+/Co2+ transporter CorB